MNAERLDCPSFPFRAVDANEGTACRDGESLLEKK
jgi:hypothetical protein